MVKIRYNILDVIFAIVVFVLFSHEDYGTGIWTLIIAFVQNVAIRELGWEKDPDEEGKHPAPRKDSY